MKHRIAIIGSATGVLLILGVVVLPMLWLASLAFRTTAEINQIPLRWVPLELNLESFEDVWLSPGYARNWPRNFVNTIISSSVTATVVSVWGVAIGYSLSRLRSRWVPRTLFFMIVVQLFNGPALVVPIFLLLNRIGLLDTLTGYVLVLMAFFLPFAALLGYNFARSSPLDLDEAAIVDGASTRQAFWLVFFPLARVGIVTIWLMTFVLTWGEYPFAIAFLQSGDTRTISVALADLVTQLSVQWNRVAAASLIASIPVVLVVVGAQKHLVKGLLSGSTKG